MIYEFFSSAFPWIVMGIGVAIVVVYMNRKNDKYGK